MADFVLTVRCVGCKTSMRLPFPAGSPEAVTFWWAHQRGAALHEVPACASCRHGDADPDVAWAMKA